MRQALYVGLLVLVGCCAGPEDSGPLGTTAESIVNGTFDSGDPAVVYIDAGCSGTLVTPKVVLTACHCLESSYNSPDVFFGSDVNSSGTWVQGVHHQVYPGNCIGNGDLAMITLAQPGPATPIPINDRDLGNHLGQQVRIVGFGVTGENSGGSGTKRQGNSTLNSVDNGVMFCDPTQVSGTCYGDSGGPNFMTFESTEYLVGATSYGTQACGSGLDASARTDTHHQWIMQYIAEHDPADCGADGACAPFCDAPDPDCPCAEDGHCTSACPDVLSDPDCNGCGVDGFCRQDCPLLDTDCCVADDECVADCGELDPDCGEGGGGENESGNGNGNGNGDNSPGGGNEQSDSEDVGDGGLVGNVVCTSAAPGGTSDSTALLMLLGIAVAASRRRA